MELNLTTPALFFSAISLLLVAFTSRFHSLAQLVRELHVIHQKEPNENLFEQIQNLRSRLIIIRNMQFFAILGFFSCILCIFLLFENQLLIAEIVFRFSLVLLMISLLLSLREIQISVKALMLQLSDCDLRQEE